jgi:hypothetical protein
MMQFPEDKLDKYNPDTKKKRFKIRIFQSALDCLHMQQEREGKGGSSPAAGASRSRIPLGRLAPAHPGAVACAGPRRRRRSPGRQQAVLLAEMVEDVGRGRRRSRPAVLVTGFGARWSVTGRIHEGEGGADRSRPSGKRRRMSRERKRPRGPPLPDLDGRGAPCPNPRPRRPPGRPLHLRLPRFVCSRSASRRICTGAASSHAVLLRRRGRVRAGGGDGQRGRGKGRARRVGAAGS